MSVVEIDNGSCQDTSECIHFIMVSDAEVLQNPSPEVKLLTLNHHIQLEFKNEVTFQTEVYDSQGRRVFSDSGRDHQQLIETDGLANGVYFIRLLMGGEQWFWRVVVE